MLMLYTNVNIKIANYSWYTSACAVIRTYTNYAHNTQATSKNARLYVHTYNRIFRDMTGCLVMRRLMLHRAVTCRRRLRRFGSAATDVGWPSFIGRSPQFS